MRCEALWCPAQALLEAERTGQTWKQLGLLPAPHFHDKDGSVKVGGHIPYKPCACLPVFAPYMCVVYNWACRAHCG